MRFPKKIHNLRTALRFMHRHPHLMPAQWREILSLEYFLIDFPLKNINFPIFSSKLWRFVSTVRFTFTTASNATPTF